LHRYAAGVAALRRLVAESGGMVAEVVEDTRALTAAVGGVHKCCTS
jgi:hypothetical protein